MGKKIFEVITDFLDQSIGGVSECLQYEVDGHNVVEGQDIKNVITAAVKHAIADFTAATGKAFNGEEHRTSVFMGNLGSCIGWYNLFSHLSSGNQTSIQWNTQKRHGTLKVDGEDTTGADFGVAIALSNGNYNLAMFQAKNAEFRAKNPEAQGKKAECVDKVEVFDINRVPSGYAAKPKKDTKPQAEHGAQQQNLEPENVPKDKSKDKSALTKAGAEADDRFNNWVEKGTIAQLKRKKEIVHGKIVTVAGAESQEKVVDHQIIKMAQQNDFAFEGCKVKRRGGETLDNWTHYVIWRDENDSSFAPVVVSLDVVRNALHTKFTATTPDEWNNYFGVSGILTGLKDICFHLPEFNSDGVSGVPFADFLISGVDSGAKGWLEVSQTQIEILVTELSELGVNWSVAGRSGGGGTPSDDPAKWLPDAAPIPTSGMMAETASTQVVDSVMVEVKNPSVKLGHG